MGCAFYGLLSVRKQAYLYITCCLCFSSLLPFSFSRGGLRAGGIRACFTAWRAFFDDALHVMQSGRTAGAPATFRHPSLPQRCYAAASLRRVGTGVNTKKTPLPAPSLRLKQRSFVGGDFSPFGSNPVYSSLRAYMALFLCSNAYSRWSP